MADARAGTFEAFSHAPYRRYWVATVARVFGLQFRFIGVGWLVASADGLDLSPVWLGIVGLATTLPAILLMVPAGVLADRYEHRRILMLSQAATAGLSLLLAFLILAERAQIGIVIVWAIGVGTLAAIATPAQSAILPRLIDRRAMASAVALTSTVWNTMRIVGPAAAGLLIAWIGIGQAFFVTAIGFALSALLLGTLRLDPIVRGDPGRDGGMWEGFRYITGQRIFLAIIGLSFFTSVFGMSYQTLLPIFAEDILDVGSQGFGFLHAAGGVGGFLGTLAMVKIGAGRFAGPIMLVAATCFGFFVAGFAGTRDLGLALALLFCGGFASAMYLNIGMTTLQLRVPDELRGRVMGVWSMTWFLAAVGGLPAGALAEWIGAPLTVTIGALAVSAFALLLLASSKELRRLATSDGDGDTAALSVQAVGPNPARRGP